MKSAVGKALESIELRIAKVLLLLPFALVGLAAVALIATWVATAFRLPSTVAALDALAPACQHQVDVSIQRVSLESLPKHVSNALVAVEDPDFWTPRPPATLRILFDVASMLFRSEPIIGKVGIAGHVAKWKLWSENPGAQHRGLERHMREVVQTDLIEMMLTKQQILEFYLTHTYFGDDAIGAECAALKQFGKSLAELTISEAAQLALRVTNPSYYDPDKYPDRTFKRRHAVLTTMADHDFISWSEMRDADARPLTVPSNPTGKSRPNGP